MAEFEVIELPAVHAAVVRREIRMDELPEFFGHAFQTVMEAATRQQVSVAGAPFGYYPRMPTDTVEVAAGFPVATPITPEGEVEVLELPAGPAVVGMHVGPYDSLEQTYNELLAWVQGEGLETADLMWESYLSDPDAEPDPQKWQTQIVWPLR
jgi:effector-binding domain-containing protein